MKRRIKLSYSSSSVTLVPFNIHSLITTKGLMGHGCLSAQWLFLAALLINPIAVVYTAASVESLGALAKGSKMGEQLGQPHPTILAQTGKELGQISQLSHSEGASPILREEFKSKKIEDLSSDSINKGIFLGSAQLSPETMEEIRTLQVSLKEYPEILEKKEFEELFLIESFRGEIFSNLKSHKTAERIQYLGRLEAFKESLPDEIRLIIAGAIKSAKQDFDADRRYNSFFGRLIRHVNYRFLEPWKLFNQELANSLRQIRVNIKDSIKSGDRKKELIQKFARIQSLFQLEYLHSSVYRISKAEVTLLKKVAKLSKDSTLLDPAKALTNAQVDLLNQNGHLASNLRRGLRASELSNELAKLQSAARTGPKTMFQMRHWYVLDAIQKRLSKIGESQFARVGPQQVIRDNEFLSNLRLALDSNRPNRLESIGETLPSSENIKKGEVNPLEAVALMVLRLDGNHAPLSVGGSQAQYFNKIQIDYLKGFEKRYDNLHWNLQKEIKRLPSSEVGLLATGPLNELIESYPSMEAKTIRYLEEINENRGLTVQEAKFMALAKLKRPIHDPESLLSLAYEQRIKNIAHKEKAEAMKAIAIENEGFIQSLAHRHPAQIEEFSKILSHDENTLAQLYDEVKLSKTNSEKAQEELQFRELAWSRKTQALKKGEKMHEEIQTDLTREFSKHDLPPFPTNYFKTQRPNLADRFTEKFQMVLIGKTGPRLDQTILKRLEKTTLIRPFSPSEENLMKIFGRKGSSQFSMEDPNLRSRFFETLLIDNMKDEDLTRLTQNLAKKLIDGKPLQEMSDAQLKLLNLLNPKEILKITKVLSLSKEELNLSGVTRLSGVLAILLKARGRLEADGVEMIYQNGLLARFAKIYKNKLNKLQDQKIKNLDAQQSFQGKIWNSIQDFLLNTRLSVKIKTHQTSYDY